MTTPRENQRTEFQLKVKNYKILGEELITLKKEQKQCVKNMYQAFYAIKDVNEKIKEFKEKLEDNFTGPNELDQLRRQVRKLEKAAVAESVKKAPDQDKIDHCTRQIMHLKKELVKVIKDHLKEMRGLKEQLSHQQHDFDVAVANLCEKNKEIYVKKDQMLKARPTISERVQNLLQKNENKLAASPPPLPPRRGNISRTPDQKNLIDAHPPKLDTQRSFQDIEASAVKFMNNDSKFARQQCNQNNILVYTNKEQPTQSIYVSDKAISCSDPGKDSKDVFEKMIDLYLATTDLKTVSTHHLSGSSEHQDKMRQILVGKLEKLVEKGACHPDYTVNGQRRDELKAITPQEQKQSPASPSAMP